MHFNLLLLILQENGPDPQKNLRLMAYMEQAKKSKGFLLLLLLSNSATLRKLTNELVNMPKATVQNCIDKAQGKNDSNSNAIEECVYEAMGPAGVPLLM